MFSLVYIEKILKLNFKQKTKHLHYIFNHLTFTSILQRFCIYDPLQGSATIADTLELHDPNNKDVT